MYFVTVLRRTLLVAGLTMSTALAGPIGFTVTTLATNSTDAQLINPWGIASSASSPLWIASNGSGVSEIYNGAGVKQGLVVTIPGAGNVTGVAFSGTADFNGDAFLFASEDGTVSGWRGALGTSAEVLAVADSNNIYKGLATGSIGGNSYAYLANFKTGMIDVLKGNGLAPDLLGDFTDPNLTSGFSPFNIQLLNGILYVSYALQDIDGEEDVPGAGNGYVDAFDLNGVFLGRVVSGGLLNSPWGMAIAPAGFGDVGGDLLVGNFGDGTINAYNATTGVFDETLRDGSGNPLIIDGLWGFRFGNGGNGGSTQTLFVTAGPDDEAGGLLAAVTAIPEPGTWILVGLGLVGVGIAGRQRSARR